MCKYREHCKFKKKGICAFKHVAIVDNKSENTKSEGKVLEEDIKNLKEDRDKLKNDVEIKENKLSEFAVKEFEMAKLLSVVTGKVAEEANFINIVQDIITENKWLKYFIKNIKKNMKMIV